jgi:hypothetical protein
MQPQERSLWFFLHSRPLPVLPFKMPGTIAAESTPFGKLIELQMTAEFLTLSRKLDRDPEQSTDW